MRSALVFVELLGLFAAGAAAACSPVVFTVTFESENVVFGNPPDPNNATAIKEFFNTSLTEGPNIVGTQPTSQTVEISGRYCSPPVGVKQIGVLQLLVHGITYTKDLWSGFGLSDEYDWEHFATSKGYHTLAIDRLGHGQSTKPEPLAVTQGPAHVSVLHELIQQIRSGSHPEIVEPEKLVYIGHSYGSAMGNRLSFAHPADVDVYVLTGYSDTVNVPVDALDLDPAAAVLPRFAGLPLGYFTFESQSARTRVFYDGPFDPAVAAHDFEVQDTVSVGELFSPGLDRVVTSFTGPVFLITGDKDFFFCSDGPPACDAVLSGTARLYPDARFEYEVVKNAGHLLTTQKSSRKVFQSVHKWLSRVL